MQNHSHDAAVVTQTPLQATYSLALSGFRVLRKITVFGSVRVPFYAGFRGGLRKIRGSFLATVYTVIGGLGGKESDRSSSVAG